MTCPISQNTPAATSTRDLPRCAQRLNTVLSIALVGAFEAEIAAFTSAIFSIANPITGAVFGGTHYVTTLISKTFWNKYFSDNSAFIASTFLLGSCAGWAVCNAVGMPITFSAALTLSVAIIPIAVAIWLAVFGIYLGVGMS